MVYPPVTQFETRALRVAAQAPLRVVVGDAAVLTRAGTARLLEEAGCVVPAQAGDARELLRKVRAHRPDVVVTDDPVAARQVRHEVRGVVVLADEPKHAKTFLEDGSEGVAFLLKPGLTDASRLADAVARVARGQTVLDPAVVADMVRRRRRGALTERERDVLEETAVLRAHAA